MKLRYVGMRLVKTVLVAVATVPTANPAVCTAAVAATS
jgi:hypothetical protein